MRIKTFLSGVIGGSLLFVSVVCHAEKWDKNDYTDRVVSAGFYDADSIKVKGTVVGWTERYILTVEGVSFMNREISKHQVCKQNSAKEGKVAQYQLDYEIEKGKFRGVAKRYYNKAGNLICTDKDTGNEFKTAWNKIVRNSPIQQAQYDLVTKYKVKFP